MNPYIKTQIRNMVQMLDAFTLGCEMASKQDDGTTDKEEQKQLDRINKVTNTYKKALEKIINKG